MYIRKMQQELQNLATQFRIVSVLDPRQAGKSTLCKITFTDYRTVSLEDSDVRLFAQTEPQGFLANTGKRIILDEVQRVPELLSYIQGIVDADPYLIVHEATAEDIARFEPFEEVEIDVGVLLGQKES